MSSFSSISLDIDSRGIAVVTLNRPQARNAMDPTMIHELGEVSDQLADMDSVRAVVLTGNGDAFCAGGDLKWMRSNFDKTRSERVTESATLATMLSRLDRLPKLLIGKINGSAYGGGIGLIAVCDIAIASSSAQFCLTETTLGLTPANISPYVVARVGTGNARSCFLNARPLSAEAAARIGLVHNVAKDDELDEAVEREIGYALRCAPGAIGATKELIRYVASHDSETNQRYTADRLADAWETSEGQEGVRCFFEKQKPSWRGGSS